VASAQWPGKWPAARFLFPFSLILLCFELDRPLCYFVKYGTRPKYYSAIFLTSKNWFGCIWTSFEIEMNLMDFNSAIWVLFHVD
jgi:hypothetical protein